MLTITHVSFFLIVGGSIVAQIAKEQSTTMSMYVASGDLIKNAAGTFLPNNDSKLIETCSTNILNSSKKHQYIQKSRKILKNFVRLEIQKKLNKAFMVIYSDMKTQNYAISKKDFIKRVNQQFSEEIDNTINKYLSKQYESLFGKARKRAVKKQLFSLKLKIYPHQSEVDKIDKYNWSDYVLNKLRQKLSKRIKGNTQVIFEENEDKIARAIQDIIDDLKNQYQNQKLALNDEAIDKKIISKKQLEKHLRNNVLLSIERMKNKAQESQKIYNIFKSINNQIGAKAAKVEQNRFQAYISDFTYAVDRSRISNEISHNLKAHHKKEQSISIIDEQTYSSVLEKVAKSYASRLDNSYNSHQFYLNLRKIAANNTETQNFIKQTIRKNIEPVIELIRSEISKKQFKRYFYEVYTGEWAISEAALKEYALGLKKIDTFNQCMRLKGLKNNYNGYQEILYETENLVVLKMKDLINIQKSAWDAQHLIVDNMNDEIERTLVNKTTNKTESQWAEHFVSIAEKRWTKDRMRIILSNGERSQFIQEKAPILFNNVVDEIKKIVHFQYSTTDRKKNKLRVKKNDTSEPFNYIKQLIAMKQTKTNNNQKNEKQSTGNRKSNSIATGGNVGGKGTGGPDPTNGDGEGNQCNGNNGQLSGIGGNNNKLNNNGPIKLRGKLKNGLLSLLLFILLFILVILVVIYNVW